MEKSNIYDINLTKLKGVLLILVLVTMSDKHGCLVESYKLKVLNIRKLYITCCFVNYSIVSIL